MRSLPDIAAVRFFRGNALTQVVLKRSTRVWRAATTAHHRRTLRCGPAQAGSCVDLFTPSSKRNTSMNTSRGFASTFRVFTILLAVITTISAYAPEAFAILPPLPPPPPLPIPPLPLPLPPLNLPLGPPALPTIPTLPQ